MTSFEDRERAFETKYAHDEELRFRITARRDKIFARWTADQLHLAEPASAEITNAVLAVQDGPGHDSRLLDHVSQIFRDHNRIEPRDTLAAELHRCGDQAEVELA